MLLEVYRPVGILTEYSPKLPPGLWLKFWWRMEAGCGTLLGNPWEVCFMHLV
jgi:hypothetical protein